MPIPINWWDVQFWVAMVSVVLLVTSEFINPALGKNSLYINKRRFRAVSYGMAIIFGLIFAVNVYLKLFVD